METLKEAVKIINENLQRLYWNIEDYKCRSREQHIKFKAIESRFDELMFTLTRLEYDIEDYIAIAPEVNKNCLKSYDMGIDNHYFNGYIKRQIDNGNTN